MFVNFYLVLSFIVNSYKSNKDAQNKSLIDLHAKQLLLNSYVLSLYETQYSFMVARWGFRYVKRIFSEGKS